MALVFNSSMQYEEDEVFDGEVEVEEEEEEAMKEKNIVELSRIIPYLCSNQMNPVWQVCTLYEALLSFHLPTRQYALRQFWHFSSI